MEGNKNAMYAKAGRNNGWQVISGEIGANIATAPETPATPMPAPPKVAVPVKPMPLPIPPPPVVATPMKSAPVSATPLPAPPVVSVPIPVAPQHVAEAPKGDTPVYGCQTLAMAHVEMQKWQELYEPEQGFSRGTLFTGLDLPFVGEGACKNE